MKLNIEKDTTSNLLDLFVQDNSLTTGVGLSLLTFSSPGLTAFYHRSNSASATQINLVDMTVGTWTSSGFKEIDAVNMPGFYQLGLPNAAVAAGAKYVTGLLKGAANMAPVPFEIQITDTSAGATDVNVISISGSAAAADNAELFFNGTGYNAANSTIGTVETIGATGLADVADGVWNESIGGHLGLGSTGASLNAKLEPTTAGRTLDVAATGEAGLDFNNINQAGGPTTLSNITVPVVITAQNLLPAERTAIADALLDEANGIEIGITPRQAIRGTARTQLGVLSGAGTNNVKIRDLINSKDAIDATVDAVGNRSVVNVDWT